MEALIAKAISGFLRAGTISTMARCSYTYSVPQFRQKLFETCQRLPIEKLGRIWTVISTWEPKNVTQTEDGWECNFFHLGLETLHKISVLLGVFNLQGGTEHPMTHVQPDFHPPSSLAPLRFLTLYRPLLSPLPPTPPRQEQPPSSPAHPEQPPPSPAHPEQPPPSPAHPEQPPPSPAHPEQPPPSPAHPEQPPPSPAHPEQPPPSPAHPEQPLSEGSLQRPSLRVVFHRVDANNYDCILKDARLIEKSKASKKRKLDDEEDENSKENKRPKN